MAAARAALEHSRDATLSQHVLYLALQGATAADFATLTRQPDGLLAQLIRSDDLPWTARQAVAEGTIERWLEVDEAGALAWFRTGGDFSEATDPRRLAAVALARLRPEEVFAHMVSLPDDKARKRLARILVAVVVEHDPTAWRNGSRGFRRESVRPRNATDGSRWPGSIRSRRSRRSRRR
ncbi:MAG: hypothetical protein ABI680_20175 [Chthoniobacteraceae bacterium]